jgi:arylsulfatase A-like enzyme
MSSNQPGGARGYEDFGGTIGRTFSQSQPWWPAEPQARDRAPNIVVVLVDDLGYSDIGPFGSEIHTPNLDRLAARGVRLTNYHTAAVCSPARAALMTGLNPHRAGFAHVASNDFGFPGYAMELADDVLSLPEILRASGYATFAIGKWHLTRDGALHDAAVRGSWPVQRGFDRYYGCLEALTNFFHPNRLTVDNSPLEVDRYPPNYYLTDDLTDRAVGMLKSLRAHSTRKPFFLYFAHHAVHGPLGAKAADIARYRGRYDAGWDALREERFRRQMEMGLFPPHTRLAARNFELGLEVPPWSAIPQTQRRLFARYQEVYAAMVDNIDQSLGRVLDTLEALGELDNTLVVFTSDNGGTAEGGPMGTRSYFSQFAQVVLQRTLPDEWPRDVVRDPDLIGGPRAAVHYPRGWGMASNTPFRLYKGNTFAGGVRVPLVISWPAGLAAREVRHPYQYVTDLHATILDLAGVPRPATRHGHPTQDIDGVSFASVLHDPAAPGTRFEQYSETRGNRGFYRDGWKLLTLHAAGTPYTDQEWCLFDVRTDPTETTNLAADFPDKVRELAAAWEAAAWANTVFPLPDEGPAPRRRRPADAEMGQPVRLLPGTPTLERYRSSRLIALRSFDVSIDLEHAAGAAGVLVAHGDQGGGYSLYLEEHRLWLAYNEYGDLKAVDCDVLEPGRHVVGLHARALPEFRWDLEVSVDSQCVGRLERVAMLLGLAPFEGIDIGIDRRSPVNWGVFERHGPFPYTGHLIGVTYTPGERGPFDTRLIAEATRDSTRVYE